MTYQKQFNQGSLGRVEDAFIEKINELGDKVLILEKRISDIE